MKAKQFFAITALGAALFASCSNEEELATGSYPNDNCIEQEFLADCGEQ